MPTLAMLRERLGLTATTPDGTFATPEEAAALLPGVSPARVQDAALALIAHEALVAVPGVASVTAALTGTLRSPKPERDLVQLLAGITGGRAEIHSSWGDLVAHAGTPDGPPAEQRLTHEGRNVGTLRAQVDSRWLPLVSLAAQFAVLARLQAAAAAAARRRVGERVLEGLLSGETHETPEAEPCVMAALAFGGPTPRGERARDARVHALDVLCAVGEGYFRERGLRCLTLVRGERALWLWHPHDPGREAADLHTALLAATADDVRLGVSAGHPTHAHAPEAYSEATQALQAVREPRGLRSYRETDPLHALLSSGALGPLRDQVRAQLAQVDTDGRIESTLRAHLRHTGTVGELAEQLNIHVNTLRYRLRRAEDALGQSLHDPGVVARLYLALNAEPDPLPGSDGNSRRN